MLLTLLYLGLKDIRLGPTLPAFLSPNVIKLLVSTISRLPSIEERRCHIATSLNLERSRSVDLGGILFLLYILQMVCISGQGDLSTFDRFQ
ncbi:MAG: hypothetical protein R3D26_07690 [Cyanobacteriota/Melainabacteria group bacterium]